MRRRFTNNLSNSFDISNYMTIEALEDNVEIIMPRVVEYGIDGEGWKKYKGSIIINLGQTASFRYILPPMQNIHFGSIVINGKYKLCGNCLSLIFGDNIRYDLTGYNHCFKELFFQNKGLLSVEPHFLPAITLAPYCYTYMFCGCTGLVTAPELPATTLIAHCYDGMFEGCSKLNYIKMLATDISASGCLGYWVRGVDSTGTFVKHPDMTSLPTGSNGIPSGWTVMNDGEESGGGGNLITFTIDGTEYQAEEGMTWVDWCNDTYYSKGEWVVAGNSIHDKDHTVSIRIYIYDTIVSGQNYMLSGVGGGGGGQ